MAKILIDSSMECKRLGLNGNEAGVLAVIAKCSRGDSPKGWFGTAQSLADYIPFAISKQTTCRALVKLLTKGVIVKRNDIYWLSQNETQPSQNETNSSQNETENGPPYNPSIINNMKEERDVTCTHACDTHTPATPTFIDFLKAFGKAYTPHTELAAQNHWKLCSDIKKRQLLAAMQANKWDRPRPDWCIGDFPEPEPTFLRGDEGGDLVQVKYNGLFKICTRQTAVDFNLPVIRDWNR